MRRGIHNDYGHLQLEQRERVQDVLEQWTALKHRQQLVPAETTTRAGREHHGTNPKAIDCPDGASLRHRRPAAVWG